MKTNPNAAVYAQGDVNFIPLSVWGKSPSDIDQSQRLRSHDSRLVLLEGEVTGHHHGFWWPQPARFHDAALASARPPVAATVPARLYRDDALVGSLPLRAGAPVIGLLILDEDSTLRHASIAGVPTDEHDDLRLPAGGYLVTGKQEQAAGDIRAVAD